MSGARLLALSIVLTSGCTRENPAYDGGSGDAGTKGTLDGPDPSTTTAVLDADGPGSGGASSGIADTGMTDNDTLATSSTTGTDQCQPPADALGYDRCGMCPGACMELSSETPVVFDLSVCVPACEESCQCPLPTSGTASPSCTNEGCVLDCSGDGVCPEGMLCHLATEQCAWSHAYGPCGESCPSGYCLYFPMVGEVCPVLDCLDGDTLDPSLCPPPSGGDATPVCFEPQEPVELQGEGWCVLSCAGGETCPPGMECSNSGATSTCLHPFE